MFAKFVGISAGTARLIENRRLSPAESEDEIIAREFRREHPEKAPQADDKPRENKELDLGQGVRVRPGERLILFLDKGSHDMRSAHGLAEVRSDGLYVDGKKISPSHGSLIQPAMRHFQAKLGHKNDKGDYISLSAYRQWHVMRDGKLVPLESLKSPALARRRRRGLNKLSGEDILRELGL